MSINVAISINVDLLEYISTSDTSILERLPQMIKYFILKLLTASL